METDNLHDDPKILMQLAKSGNTEAFGRLYEIYFMPVFRYIYFCVKDKEEANDLTQTVFIKVFCALPNFKEQNKSPLAYFFTVSRNIVIDYWRAKKRIILAGHENDLKDIADKTNNPIELAEKKETIQVIQRAIQELTDIQQEVIILKFINDIPNKNIAELMDKTEEAVRQLQCRALKRLKQILKTSDMNRLYE